jgi:hypothetical protein
VFYSLLLQAGAPRHSPSSFSRLKIFCLHAVVRRIQTLTSQAKTSPWNARTLPRRLQKGAQISIFLVPREGQRWRLRLRILPFVVIFVDIGTTYQNNNNNKQNTRPLFSYSFSSISQVGKWVPGSFLHLYIIGIRQKGDLGRW